MDEAVRHISMRRRCSAPRKKAWITDAFAPFWASFFFHSWMPLAFRFFIISRSLAAFDFAGIVGACVGLVFPYERNGAIRSAITQAQFERSNNQFALKLGTGFPPLTADPSKPSVGWYSSATLLNTIGRSWCVLQQRNNLLVAKKKKKTNNKSETRTKPETGTLGVRHP